MIDHMIDTDVSKALSHIEWLRGELIKAREEVQRLESQNVQLKAEASHRPQTDNFTSERIRLNQFVVKVAERRYETIGQVVEAARKVLEDL